MFHFSPIVAGYGRGTVGDNENGTQLFEFKVHGEFQTLREKRCQERMALPLAALEFTSTAQFTTALRSPQSPAPRRRVD
jgi:hypothetical protein